MFLLFGRQLQSIGIVFPSNNRDERAFSEGSVIHHDVSVDDFPRKYLHEFILVRSGPRQHPGARETSQVPASLPRERLTPPSDPGFQETVLDRDAYRAAEQPSLIIRRNEAFQLFEPNHGSVSASASQLWLKNQRVTASRLWLIQLLLCGNSSCLALNPHATLVRRIFLDMWDTDRMAIVRRATVENSSLLKPEKLPDAAVKLFEDYPPTGN